MKTTSYPKEKIKILLVEGVHPAAVEEFSKAGYTQVESYPKALGEEELKELVKDFHILGIRSKTRVTPVVMESANKLLAVGCFCIGTNQVSMDAAADAGIAVFNSPFSNTRSVAELVIGATILLMRRVVEKNEAVQKGAWMKDSNGCYEVRGKTMGIIGYGHIGSQVSVLAESLGMKVIFYDVEPKLAMGNASAEKSLELLLKKSDIVTLHVPGTPLTKNMMNAERIKQMKKGAVLINYSRGDVIDVPAIKKAVEEKHLGGAAVDVFTNEPKVKGDPFVTPLQHLPNVLLTPHIGGSTVEAQENIGIDAATKLISFMDTGSTVGCLSVPALTLPVQEDAHRVLHIHKNVPGVLSEINGILSGMNANILGQYLKTNSKIGYVVLDVDKAASQKVVDALKQVKHTIRVRGLY